MMKAYAIFDGGGALGAALAGCFAAAREQGIEFVGYGGTSAGSIVALLGAVGLDGPAMERFLVDTSFGDFLGASGRRSRTSRRGSGRSSPTWSPADGIAPSPPSGGSGAWSAT